MAADLNGDSGPDLAVADGVSSKVLVFLGTGDGTLFGPAQNFGTGDYSASVAAADLNRDGKPDLVVANYSSNNVSVLLNTTLTPPNAAPQATGDAYSTNEDTALAVGAPGVLSNDTDADGDALSAALVSGPAHATSFTLNEDGSFSYTPSANFNGTDSFTYKAKDGTADSNTATVKITVTAVNDAPVADPDAITSNEDGSGATNVLAGDTDVDGNDLDIASFTQPSNGSLTCDNETGQCTYTPNANFNGTDSFTYKATDGSAQSDDATVSITVTAVDDLPDAIDDGSTGNPAATTNEDTPSQPINVLGNDTGLGDGSIKVSIKTQGSKGTATVNDANDMVTYTPDANENGPDTFVYEVCDGDEQPDCDEATVHVSISAVNEAPEAANDTYSTNEDTTLTVGAPGVLSNDTDADGDALTAALVNDVEHGTLTLDANGSFAYTPANNYNGSDSFTYKARDGAADSEPVRVSVTVDPVNDARGSQRRVGHHERGHGQRHRRALKRHR